MIGEKKLVLPQCDAVLKGSRALPLHAGVNPRMYGVLTANTPGCVAFSLPVQRRNLLTGGTCVFPDPSTASAARG